MIRKIRSNGQLRIWESLIARVCLVTLAFAPLASAQQFGAGIHPSQSVQIIEPALAKGSFSLRIDFHWSAIETKKGVLSFPAQFNDADALITNLTQHGIEPIINLNYGNAFYGGGDNGGELPKSPEAIEGFANYASFIVSHFKGRVNLFEVYNEWNLNITSEVTPHVWGDPASYVNLLRAAYGAIKSANPRAIVIGGAVGGTDTNWINNFIEAGGLTYLDAFSIHPYTFDHVQVPNPPSGVIVHTAAVVAQPLPVLGTPEESIAWIDQIKTRIDSAAAGKAIPIYVTEIGWPTNTGGVGVSEQVSAAYLQRFMLMARARPWISGVWWYDLIDDGSDASDEEDRFGLLRQSGDAKPAFNSFLQIAGELEKKDISLSEAASGQMMIVTATSGKEKLCAAWMSTNNFNISYASADVAFLLSTGCRAPNSTSKLGAVPLLFSN